MNRRNFIALLAGAALANYLPIKTKADAISYEWESRPEMQRMMRRFDRKTMNDKREFIENLGKIKSNATREDSKDLAVEMNKIFKEMQIFYQRRLEATR